MNSIELINEVMDSEEWIKEIIEDGSLNHMYIKDYKKELESDIREMKINLMTLKEDRY